MSENTQENTNSQPQFKPFRQIPVVNPKDELTITGEEFNVVQTFINSFLNPISAVDAIFKRNINAGKIVYKYVDQEGNEISKQEVEDQLKQMEEYYKSQRDSMKVIPADTQSNTPAGISPKKLKTPKAAAETK